MCSPQFQFRQVSGSGEVRPSRVCFQFFILISMLSMGQTRCGSLSTVLLSDKRNHNRIRELL